VVPAPEPRDPPVPHRTQHAVHPARGAAVRRALADDERVALRRGEADGACRHDPPERDERISGVPRQVARLSWTHRVHTGLTHSCSPTPIYNQYSVAPALPPKDARPAIAPLARLQTTNRTTVGEVRPL
jgi:hypothetical protein